MTLREKVEWAITARARRVGEEITRVLRRDAPPAIGSGDAGTFDLNGQRQVPPFVWHPYAPTVPACAGARCPAWDRATDDVGTCLVDPTAAGPEARGAFLVGDSICPLGVQRLAADLAQANAWVYYLQKTAGRGRL